MTLQVFAPRPLETVLVFENRWLSGSLSWNTRVNQMTDRIALLQIFHHHFRCRLYPPVNCLWSRKFACQIPCLLLVPWTTIYDPFTSKKISCLTSSAVLTVDCSTCLVSARAPEDLASSIRVTGWRLMNFSTSVAVKQPKTGSDQSVTVERAWNYCLAKESSSPILQPVNATLVER